MNLVFSLLATRNQPPAVRAEKELGDRTQQGPRIRTGVEIPDFDLGGATPRAARKPPAVGADGNPVGPRLLAAKPDLTGLEIEHDRLVVRLVGDRKGPTVRSQAQIGWGVECRWLVGLWGLDLEAEPPGRSIDSDRPALKARSPAGDQAPAIRLEEGRAEARHCPEGDLLRGSHVPEPHAITACHRHQPAIGAEIDIRKHVRG